MYGYCPICNSDLVLIEREIGVNLPPIIDRQIRCFNQKNEKNFHYTVCVSKDNKILADSLRFNTDTLLRSPFKSRLFYNPNDYLQYLESDIVFSHKDFLSGRLNKLLLMF